MLKILFTFLLIVYALVFIADVSLFLALVIDAIKIIPKEKKQSNFCKSIGGALSMIAIVLIPIVNLIVLNSLLTNYEQILKKSVER